MDADAALADLREVSSQVEAAVLVDSGGAVEAATLEDEERARELAAIARELVEAVEAAQPRRAPVRQLEAATASGSVFVVRDAQRSIAATTSAAAISGLVFYDLKTCLRAVGDGAAA